MIDTDGNEWAAQLKVDGYRALVHIKDRETGHEVKVFSRRMNDISESVPEIVNGTEFPAGEYILDGEIIAENGSYSDTSARIGRKEENVERGVEMEYKVFDSVIYAGENIWNKPYRKRHEKLKSLDLNTGDTIELLPLEFDYKKAKKQALENEQEGLILKRMDALYEFDNRSSSWVKHKFDDETVDLNIAGFDEGEGRLDGTLGRVKLETSDGVFVGYSGSGFSDAERETIWNNQDEWMGRTIEIEARGLGTENKLRMPIFVRDRQADGTADSWERVQEVMADV